MSASMGTSAAMRLAVSAPALADDASTWCYRAPTLEAGTWVSGAATSGCGNVVDDARQTFFGGADFATIEPLLRPAPADVPTYLPFDYGERSPGWHVQRRFGFVDATGRHDAVARYQGVLLGVACNLRQCFEALTRLNGTPDRARLSGGVLASPLWTQQVADVLGTDLEICRHQHSSIVGAIRLGLSALGADDVSLPSGPARVVRPNPDLAGYYAQRYAAYLAAYAAAT
jgi:gluconokinase